MLTSYSTLLEICKSSISGRKNREKRDERIRFVSSFIVQYNNISYLYKNYKYFYITPIEEKLYKYCTIDNETQQSSIYNPYKNGKKGSEYIVKSNI